MSKVKKPVRLEKSGLKAKHKFPIPRPPSQKKSINALKTKIRDTERLLKRADDLPAGVRIEKERALRGFRQDVEKIAKEKARSKMISKYHKVRFFERQKANRILKKLTRIRDTASFEDNERDHIEAAVLNARTDLDYTIYSPLDEKYHSLYAKSRGAGASEETPSAITIDITAMSMCASQRPPMWHIVKHCTEEGTLESLRDGKLSSRYTATTIDVGQSLPGADVPGEKTKRRNSKVASSPSQSLAHGQHGPAEEEESDGAFFE